MNEIIVNIIHEINRFSNDVNSEFDIDNDEKKDLVKLITDEQVNWVTKSPGWNLLESLREFVECED